MFCERPKSELKALNGKLSKCFNIDGRFCGTDCSDLMPLIDGLNGNKRIRVQETVLERLDMFLEEKQMAELAQNMTPPAANLKNKLYPYQKDGVQFGLFKKAAALTWLI